MRVRLPSSFRPLLVLLLLVLGASLAHAGTRESKDWIVDARAHRFLKALAENLGTDDTELGKDHAAAI